MMKYSVLLGVAAESQYNMFTIVVDYTAKGFSVQSPAKRNKGCCRYDLGGVQREEVQSFKDEVEIHFNCFFDKVSGEVTIWSYTVTNCEAIILE